jgi:hypothetical protein
MKVTLESTTRVVEVVTPSGIVPARVWEGETESGIKVVALITRIAHHKRDDAFAHEFEAELKAQRTPSEDALKAFPARLIL